MGAMADHGSGSDGLWERGYQIFPSVYSDEEIQRLRGGAYAYRGSKEDLLSTPHLRSVLLNRRMVEIARALLGAQPIYFGDSACVFNGLSGFHKDNPDRHDGNGPDWTRPERYSLIRFGLFLQDYSEHSGGVGFRVGSHNNPDRRAGASVYAASRPGDLIVWSLRTTHRGQVHLLRWPRLPLPTKLVPRIPGFARIAQPEGDRIGLFWTIGADGPHFERYIDYLRTRIYAIERWQESVYDEDMRRLIEAAGLELRDLRAEVLAQDNSRATAKHTALPY
jgi:hypothetical protein